LRSALAGSRRFDEVRRAIDASLDAEARLAVQVCGGALTDERVAELIGALSAQAQAPRS
jgi:hypothetical protein